MVPNRILKKVKLGDKHLTYLPKLFMLKKKNHVRKVISTDLYVFACLMLSMTHHLTLLANI